MIAICNVESQGNPFAANWDDHHRGCDGSFGIMQIGCSHGYSQETLNDPSTNIRIAHRVWKIQGLRAWTTTSRLLSLIY